jgi:hypothetical protein
VPIGVGLSESLQFDARYIPCYTKEFAMMMTREGYENTLDDTQWVERVISYTVQRGAVLDWPVGDRFMSALQEIALAKDPSPEQLERTRQLGYADQRQRRKHALYY